MKFKVYGSGAFRDSCMSGSSVAAGSWPIYTDASDWGLSICAYL